MSHPQPTAIPRHYGLDWLRIGAFGLLIAFHTGLYFAPGHWIVKSPEPATWLAWPLAAIVPWRLSVLFAVSGYATAAMIQRHRSLAAFAAERSKRLLIPLLFGMLVVIPPQEWVRLEVSGAHVTWAQFLNADAFSFARHAGSFMPGWEHLWFLPYLLAYTLILVSLLAIVRDWRERTAQCLAWLSVGRRLLWVPAAIMALGMALLSRTRLHSIADSADYIPAFVLGFAYAHSAELRLGFRRHCYLAAVSSAFALAVLWILLGLGAAVPDKVATTLALIAGAAMSWTMVVACFVLAERLFNRDHRWRQPLAAAVFPAYIVHQTAIVVAGWALTRHGVVGLPAFAALVSAVVGACGLAWLAARFVPGAGTVLGMPGKSRPQPRPAPVLSST